MSESFVNIILDNNRLSQVVTETYSHLADIHAMTTVPPEIRKILMDKYLEAVHEVSAYLKLSSEVNIGGKPSAVKNKTKVKKSK